jgi:hypothetical protein
MRVLPTAEEQAAAKQPRVRRRRPAVVPSVQLALF